MKETNRKILVKVKVGSNLYGTNGPESDTDYKGVFLPTLEELVLGPLGNCPKSIKLGTGNDHSKNTKDDVDYELWSLQYYLCLLQKGDTNAVEMLFAPDEMLEVTSPEWEFLRANRSKFITKKMKSFLGYCRTQASKYSAKGGRMATLKKVMDYLLSGPMVSKDLQSALDMPDNPSPLKNWWEYLPEGEYIRKYVEPRNNMNMYEICGRKFEETADVEYVYEQLEKVYDGYGARAKQAETSEGVDWKAVSHAFRVGYELMELLETGDLKFPLEDADYLKDIKYGKMNFKEDGLEDQLEVLLHNLEVLVEKSTFPESVNMKPFERFVKKIYAYKPAGWYEKKCAACGHSLTYVLDQHLDAKLGEIFCSGKCKEEGPSWVGR